MSDAAEADQGVTEAALRLGAGFEADERDWVTRRLSNLDRRLARFGPEQVTLEISVKDRDTAQQRVVLDCSITGLPRNVATSVHRDLSMAVNEVRDDLVRQINALKTKLDPRNRPAAPPAV